MRKKNELSSRRNTISCFNFNTNNNKISEIAGTSKSGAIRDGQLQQKQHSSQIVHHHQQNRRIQRRENSGEKETEQHPTENSQTKMKMVEASNIQWWNSLMITMMSTAAVLRLLMTKRSATIGLLALICWILFKNQLLDYNRFFPKLYNSDK